MIKYRKRLRFIHYETVFILMLHVYFKSRFPLACADGNI